MIHRQWVTIGLCALLAAPVSAEIYTVFSDNGLPNVPPNTVISYGLTCGGQGCTSEGFNGNSTDIAPPEGFTSWKTTATLSSPNEYAGWGLAYNSPQDLSRFNSGELRFWIHTDTGRVKVEIKGNGVDFVKMVDTDLGWTPALANQWVHYSIPLTGVPLTQTINPFLFTVLGGPSAFYIDNVRYVDNTVTPNYFNATLKNKSDNSPASQLAWPAVALPQGWVLSNQYIQLTVDPNILTWGVQIYTDNTNASASPKFTGDPTVMDPGGLVDNMTGKNTLTMAWSIHPDTVNTTVTAGNPDVDTEWLYLQDQKTPKFTNGIPYATVKNNQGIQYSPNQFGAQEVPPNPIYLEANFANAVTPNTYTTNQLIVEYFTP